MNNKRVIVLTNLVILIAITTVLSISYGIWAQTKVQESSTIINSSCLNIEFNELTQFIDLRRVSPNNEGANYYFKVTNTCESKAFYEVNLETLEGTNLDSKYLNIDINGYSDDNKSFLNEEGKKLSEYELTTKTIEDALYSNNLYKGSLEYNTSNTFKIHVSFYSDSNDLDAQNKTWLSKVVVNSYTPSSIEDNNKSYTNKEDTIKTLLLNKLNSLNENGTNDFTNILNSMPDIPEGYTFVSADFEATTQSEPFGTPNRYGEYYIHIYFMKDEELANTDLNSLEVISDELTGAVTIKPNINLYEIYLRYTHSDEKTYIKTGDVTSGVINTIDYSYVEDSDPIGKYRTQVAGITGINYKANN